ncbi:MAG: GNAT family N-acetyltransferase [Leptolinea sp.]|nr:GNAT family N-acetyltransferase [Leptolinea sp.]
MLTGKRIRLRALEPTDLVHLTRWKNDPDVIENLLINTPSSINDEQRRYEELMKRPDEEHPFAIELNEQNQWVLIGTTRFHTIDWKNRSVEFGVCIGEKEHWNKGYARDAVRLLLRHAFNNLNLNRVFLYVFETNERARKMYTATGFVEEGRLRQDIYKNGRYLDVLVMSVLRNEWQDAEV